MIINCINKIVGAIINPLSIGMLLVLAGAVAVWFKRCQFAKWMLCIAFVWFWVWSMPVMRGWLALPLESKFAVFGVEDLPAADAIVLMGGGVCGDEDYPYAMLKDGADRAWHAARLWKAKKAPVVIPSNRNAELCDLKFLVDLGVPRDSIILENKAVNTEENAKFVAEILRSTVNSGEKKKILIVTSACHMLRSMYMFEKYAPDIECIPAATDYQALPWKDKPYDWVGLLPNISAFSQNNDFVHEYLGYYGYKWFR